MRLPRGSPAASVTPVKACRTRLVRPTDQRESSYSPLRSGQWRSEACGSGARRRESPTATGRHGGVFAIVSSASFGCRRRVATAPQRVRIGTISDFERKLTKFCFTWIRFFLQCCANVVFAITLREALCTDMVESLSPPCATGFPVRLVCCARHRARVASAFRSGLCGPFAAAGRRWAHWSKGRLSVRFSAGVLSIAPPSRTFRNGNCSDRFRHARMIWSSSRLAVRRCAMQRLSGGVLPPQ
jgi:hypothetical protein